MSDVLQEMRSLFKDNNFKITLALIEKVHIAADRSFVRAECTTLPDSLKIIADVSSDSVGSQSITLPNKDDLVLVAFTDDNFPVVLTKLFSESDKIPQNAVTGDTVLRSLIGKKTWITSDTRINLSQNDTIPTENLVLGQVFKTFADDLLTLLATKFDNDSVHKHIGNLGVFTTPTDKATDDQTSKSDVEDLASSPIGDDAILSDLAFTEKGA